jgi:DNA transformation protein
LIADSTGQNHCAALLAGNTPSSNLLWAREGALTDRDWKEVAREDRTSLLILLDDYEKSRK